MDRNGFIDFNTTLSTEKSGKAYSYARAIDILDKVLVYQNKINLHGLSLYDISDTAVIEEVLRLVNGEVRKMKQQLPNIFEFDNSCSRIMTNTLALQKEEN